MNSLLAMLASFALLLPAANGVVSDSAAGGQAAGGMADDQGQLAAPQGEGPAPVTPDLSRRDPWRIFLDARQPQVQDQVRIEQRIILRVTPRPGPVRQDMVAPIQDGGAGPPPRGPLSPGGPPPMRFAERKLGACVPMQGIASVGTGPDNRLILFMRDRRLVSVALEKACNARQFYSGFLIERNEDGMLCVKRDKLQSRTGAKCELRQFRQLVPPKN